MAERNHGYYAGAYLGITPLGGGRYVAYLMDEFLADGTTNEVAQEIKKVVAELRAGLDGLEADG